jgi:hypothetical protein
MLEEMLRSLRELPDDVRELDRRMTGVEVQVLQLRTEMRDELSAIRGQMSTKQGLADGLAVFRSEMATKQDLADGLAAVRSEMATKNDLVELRSELREDIAGMGQDLARIILETQRQIGEGQSQTRMMFEEIVSRLKFPGEGNVGPAP